MNPPVVHHGTISINSKAVRRKHLKSHNMYFVLHKAPYFTRYCSSHGTVLYMALI